MDAKLTVGSRLSSTSSDAHRYLKGHTSRHLCNGSLESNIKINHISVEMRAIHLVDSGHLCRNGATK